ncbi:MAG: ATP-binding cassette domain-containing protein [Candidatus Latescibacteria bacterium]|nr:ATP-binding cassette domain-containing protein [Candidatus Latescibacterota bacterium]
MPTDFSVYRRLYTQYLGPLWPRMVGAAVLLLAGIGTQLLAPQILRQFIDQAQQGVPLAGLYGTGLLFLGLGLAGHIVQLLALYASGDVGWRATNQLRRDLARHVLRLDLAYHEKRTPGELIERIDGDVGRLDNFFSGFTVRLLGGVLLAGGVVVVLALEEILLGLGLALFAGLYLLAHMRAQGIAGPFWRQESQSRAELSGYVGERLAGVVDMRTSAAVAYTMQGLYRKMRRYFWAFCKAEIATDLGWTLSNIVFGVGFAVALALGAWQYREQTLTIGTVYLIVHYLHMLRGPLNAISGQLEDWQKIRVSIERIGQLQDQQSAISGGQLCLPVGALGVELKDLSFAYQPGKPVLEHISLRLEAGEVLGLLGRTGSGKTTLSRLLVRLYEAEPGRVFLGGVELTQVELGQLRQRVGLVTQEVQLFEASLRDNIRLFDEEIGDAQIEESLHLLGLDAWYGALPEGLDTQLVAGGGLSAGQAQLLACARVFLKDPGLVILDEASSRLDPASQYLLEGAIDRLLQGRTGVIIAHRLATVQRADQIAVLEEGRLGEYGPRQRLAAEPDSAFSRLLRMGLEEV